MTNSLAARRLMKGSMALALLVMISVTGCAVIDAETSPMPLRTAISQLPVPEPSSAVGVTCPRGVSPPLGVSSLVCGGIPEGAADDPAVAIGSEGEYGIYSFTLPSENIVCDWYVTTVGCLTREASFTPAPKDKDCDLGWLGYSVWVDSTAYKGICTGDQMEGLLAESLPVLGYGRSIYYGNFACLSAEDGMTCWNTETHHGFKISRSVQLTW